MTDKGAKLMRNGQEWPLGVSPLSAKFRKKLPIPPRHFDELQKRDWLTGSSGQGIAAQCSQITTRLCICPDRARRRAPAEGSAPGRRRTIARRYRLKIESD